MAGVTVLAIQGGSQLNLLTRRRPVTTLADFRGLRIRTPSEIAPLLRSLGADPVTMPMAEVYSALSKGVIDGVVAPPDTLSSLHFNEVAPYLNAWSIPRGAYPGRAISNKALARLPADLQSLLKASQPYWEGQLNASVEHGRKAGLAFGHAHHEHFLPVPADQQASFIRQYNAASLGRAMALSGAKFDAKAMFEEAARAVAAQRSGRPAC
jgi:TRAP-type C4-dicarboxylate transport system substrate-binding protein